MPVDELVLTTKHDEFVIAQAFCRDLSAFAAEIARRINGNRQ